MRGTFSTACGGSAGINRGGRDSHQEQYRIAPRRARAERGDEATWGMQAKFGNNSSALSFRGPSQRFEIVQHFAEVSVAQKFECS